MEPVQIFKDSWSVPIVDQEQISINVSGLSRLKLRIGRFKSSVPKYLKSRRDEPNKEDKMSVTIKQTNRNNVK